MRYDKELKKIINITASLTYWDGSNNNNQIQFSRNFKSIRLCNRTDFKNSNYAENFEEIAEHNFDHCVDNYDGMVVSNNINQLINDNLLFEIKSCDPNN